MSASETSESQGIGAAVLGVCLLACIVYLFGHIGSGHDGGVHIETPPPVETAEPLLKPDHVVVDLCFEWQGNEVRQFVLDHPKNTALKSYVTLKSGKDTYVCTLTKTEADLLNDRSKHKAELSLTPTLTTKPTQWIIEGTLYFKDSSSSTGYDEHTIKFQNP